MKEIGNDSRSSITSKNMGCSILCLKSRILILQVVPKLLEITSNNFLRGSYRYVKPAVNRQPALIRPPEELLVYRVPARIVEPPYSKGHNNRTPP